MDYISFLKKGSGIHIKKENKGKFTKSAKQAGEGVQEHAHKVMNDPKATPLQRKRANFAIQAKKWAKKHDRGGYFSYSYPFIPTKLTLDDFVRLMQSVGEDKAETSRTSQSIVSDPWQGYTGNIYITPTIEATQVTLKPSAKTVASKNTQTQAYTSRGYRNNNPLNLRISNNSWLGKLANNSDKAFEQFDTMIHGYRAAIKNMQTQINRGYNTISKLINVWAPAADSNNPESYANFVAQRAGMSKDQKIDLTNKDQIKKIVAAMARIENGSEANLSDIDTALNLI